VDQEFINLQLGKYNPSINITTIIYAGNLGHGQGLEMVVPSIAKLLGDSYKFVIVGDGGTASLLKEAILKENLNNVEMVLPVSRTELLKYYRDADILFLHLNDLPAFRRVLPSKIFEYTALGKPIVAGLIGYSAQFMREQVPYASLFDPGDSEGACSAILKASETVVPRDVVDKFVSYYSRETIMDLMAEHLLDVMSSHR
jgi:glycosyltransferase involved in cell wall biosynthesis